LLVEQREPAIESRLDLHHAVYGRVGALRELTADADSHLRQVGRGTYRNLVANVNGV
jgi:hypothetical protein